MRPPAAPALQPLLDELRARLHELYGERLVKLLLYGSHARGEARPDSDVDIMIVLQGGVERSKEMARTSRLIAELSLRHDLVISRAFKSEVEFAARQSPLLRHVQREGISL